MLPLRWVSSPGPFDCRSNALLRIYITIYKKIFIRIDLFQNIPNSRQLFEPNVGK